MIDGQSKRLKLFALNTDSRGAILSQSKEDHSITGVSFRTTAPDEGNCRP